ncbi:right-handed parallel beta-helix repeat-containing protein [Candidatus Bathyarchaeota archaeon]|nr:right-handed parallel beta-helix repeat-containing protein [Candidatus Bathyarchaeota archaeon]
MQLRKIAMSLLVLSCFIAFTLNNVNAESQISAKSVSETGSSLIQELINSANPRDTILIPNGTYYEHVVVNKSINLIGAGWNKTVIDGSGIGDVIKVTANNTMVSGFTIRNAGYSGIRVYNCSYGHFISNTIREGNYGIKIDNSHVNIIAQNNLTQNNVPIALHQSDNNLIKGNLLYHNFGQAISTYNSHGNIIENNDISDNPTHGIYLENCENSIIASNKVTYVCFGIWIYLSQNCVVTANKVANTGPWGIITTHSNNTLISSNTLFNNEIAMQISFGKGNLAIGNNITENKLGFYIDHSFSNILKGNVIAENWPHGSFGVVGSALQDFINDVDTTNTVDGKPIYYWVNRHDCEVPASAGYLALVNCSNIIALDLNLSGNYQGVMLAFSKHVMLKNLNLSTNFTGLWIVDSDNNTVYGCTLKSNVNGIYMENSNHNTFVYNNFIGERLLDISENANFWDAGYPSGGNYWSDYLGSDTDGDGIGDVPKTINTLNRDNYPFKGAIYTFNVGEWNGTTYHVQIISNSTISGFSFDPDEGAYIRFNVTEPFGLAGFCRVIVPKQLLWALNDQWIITIDDQQIQPAITSSTDSTYLYFTYSQFSGTILIEGTGVISEFSLFQALLFLLSTIMGVTLARYTIRRKRLFSNYRFCQ